VFLAMKYEIPAMLEPGGGAILRERLEAFDEDARREVAAQVTLGRLGRVDEVAHTVAWPLSEQASFLTGATIPVDGGRLAGGA
jgi:NAD(P)-dependent dehydrogenase (short-subunit alcohol dehydrogenase family)